MEIRVGMLGFGEAGRRHALAWRSLALLDPDLPGRVRLVGLAVEPEAVPAHDPAGFEFQTHDPEEVIACPEVDILDVCAPRGEHAPLLRSAFAAGKHVLCAPPLAADAREAEEVAALSGRIAGKKQMASAWRWLPALERARAMIRDGMIGEPQVFRLACRRPLAVPAPDDPAPDVADSVLYGLLPHALDVTQALNGDIVEVNASVEAMLDPRSEEARPTQEVVACLLRFTNGSVGVLEAARSLAGPAEGLRVEISGSEGLLAFDLSCPEALSVATACGEPVRMTVPGSPPCPGAGLLSGEVLGLHAFLRAIANDEPTDVGFRDGLMAQRIIETVVESADVGGWLPVPLGR